MISDFALWNLDSRKIGAAIGDINGKMYNWNNGGWDQISNPIYDVHIKPFVTPYTSGSLCSDYSHIVIPAAPLNAAQSACVLMFDISTTGAPVACDLLANPFISTGPYPTRSSFGFR